MEKELTGRYEIREAIIPDVLAVRRMQADAWLETYPSPENGVSSEWVKTRVDGWFTPDGIEKSKEIVGDVLQDQTHFYRVATRGERVVGFVHARTLDDGKKELQAIYTAPDTFGSGLGQQLIDQALEWIGETGCKLEVATYNARAIRFYEKNGFKVVEGSEHMYRETMPVIWMKREGVTR